MDSLDIDSRRTVIKNVIEKFDVALSDIRFILTHHECFPELTNIITPQKFQSIIDDYFTYFKIDLKYQEPDNVITLICDNVTLQKKVADLQYKIAYLTHRVEHFKYLTKHVSNMYLGIQTKEAVAP